MKAADHDRKIILWMQQVHAPAISIIRSISDVNIRERLFSFFYYMAEMEFSAQFSYYIPPRLLTGNSMDNVTQWGNSARDFTDARSQLLDSMSHYGPTRSAVQLQAMSAIAAAILERYNLELVEELEKAFT